MLPHEPFPDAETAFRRVTNWSRAFLELERSPQLANALHRLLETLGQIALTTQVRSQDQFETLKQLEHELDQAIDEFAQAGASQAAARVPPHAAPPAAAGTTFVFLYGTLKRGFSRAHALAGQSFHAEAVTKPQYRMFDCGSYPGLVEHDDGLPIEGEVWSVSPDCLRELDEIEGVELNLYRRVPIKLEPPFDQEHVEAYMYCRNTRGLPDCGTSWSL